MTASIDNVIEKFSAQTTRIENAIKIRDFVFLEMQKYMKRDRKEDRLWDKRINSLGEEYGNYGVYIIWDKEEKECYIGKASQKGSYLGARIWSHFGTLKELESCNHDEIAKQYWGLQFPEAHHMTVIFLPESLKYFASALEEYLLEELNDRCTWNKVGRKK